MLAVKFILSAGWGGHGPLLFFCKQKFFARSVLPTLYSTKSLFANTSLK